MTAYCFWDVKEIHDQPAIDDYVSRVTETVEIYGGRYVVVGGPWQVVEGEWHPTYPVLIEFPTIDAANAWYQSEQYAALKTLRLGASSSDAVFFDSTGMDDHLAAERAEVPA